MALDDHSVNPGGIRFFESVLQKHSAVESWEQLDNQYYRVTRTHGDILGVYLSGIYVFSIIEYHEVKREHPGVDSIVLAGGWQNVSPDAKEQADADCIGLFKLKGFMGSLGRAEHWSYDGPAAEN